MKIFFLLLAFAIASSFAKAQCSVNLVTSANVDCAGACTGWATVAGNGIPPFSYLWSNNDTGATATNLCAGAHTVMMFDAGGCSAFTTVIITEPPPIASSFSVTYLNCSCQVTSYVSGGVPPYAYLWCDGSTAPMMNSCFPGLCILTIVDGNGCILTDTAIISPPPALSINPVITNTTCGGCSDGMIIINPSGGLMPYQFSVNGNPVANDTISNLPAGTYVVCLMDEWSCTVCDTLQISDPTGISSPLNSKPLFIVGPVPAKGKLSITGPQSSEPVSIELYDQIGERVLIHFIQKSSAAFRDDVNILGLSPGIFNYIIRSEKKIFQSGRIVIDR